MKKPDELTHITEDADVQFSGPLAVVVPLVLVLLACVPVLAATFGASWRDAMRAAVLAETITVGGLYVATLVNIFWHIRYYTWQDYVVRQMAMARGMRILGCLALMVLGSVDLVERFGHAEIAWFTPILSLCDLLFLQAWLWMDLRRWQAP